MQTAVMKCQEKRGIIRHMDLSRYPVREEVTKARHFKLTVEHFLLKLVLVLITPAAVRAAQGSAHCSAIKTTIHPIKSG
jgi:hypothetical protein